MRGLSKRTLELIAFAREVLAAHHPMTLRQLHYAIFSAAKIDYENEPYDYKRLSRVTTTARRNYRTLELAEKVDLLDSDLLNPLGRIVDELHEAERASSWENAADFMDALRPGYRRANWQDQPNYCEVWSEKATVLDSLRPLTQEYGVILRDCRGFGSTGMESQIGNLFEGIDKPIMIFYLSDHDPSGIDIERDIHRRARRDNWFFTARMVRPPGSSSSVPFHERRQAALHIDEWRFRSLGLGIEIAEYQARFWAIR
jgi:hypothetical protein